MAKKHKRKQKKTLKILLITLVLLLTLTIFLGLYFTFQKDQPIHFFSQTTDQKLEKLGYNSQNIELIHQTLKDTSIDILLNNDFQAKIPELLAHKDFQEENLKKYLKAYQLYSFPTEDIIYLVNQQNYDEAKQYTKEMVSFMKGSYYLEKNLDRYLAYYQKNNKLEIDQVIQKINANLDYEYYTNTQKTDTSKGYLMIVNKYNFLSSDYKPANLVTISTKHGRSNIQAEKKTYEQFVKMFDAAKKEGLTLYITSPYRSYQTQATLYKNYVARDGKKEADTYSARAGFSEHQTGLALDILTPGATMNNFEKKKECTWLKKNAYKYGFILRYPKGKEDLTGYMYESWHYRYVGEEAANLIYGKDITFDEYYAYYVK